MLTSLVLKQRPAELTQREHTRLRAAITEVREYRARELVTPAHRPLTCSVLLLQGMLARYVDDRRGDKQMVALHVPGDFVDLHGYPLKVLDHEVRTLTPASAAIVPHGNLDAILRGDPSLALKLWYLTMLDAAMHRQWIFRIGRLRAPARLAHFLCEINARLWTVELSDGCGFDLPLTQGDLGAICGLSSVHVNRAMRQLRELGLVTLCNQRVEIHDLPALVKLGEFQVEYLYLKPELIARVLGGAMSQPNEAATPPDRR